MLLKISSSSLQIHLQELSSWYIFINETCFFSSDFSKQKQDPSVPRNILSEVTVSWSPLGLLLHPSDFVVPFASAKILPGAEGCRLLWKTTWHVSNERNNIQTTVLSYTPWTELFAPENRPGPNWKVVFQPSIFRCFREARFLKKYTTSATQHRPPGQYAPTTHASNRAAVLRQWSCLRSHVENLPPVIAAKKTGWKGLYTLPETNIAPENGWLEDEFTFGKAYFQGLC